MDLNGDGFDDILSGSYSRNEQPMAGLFQVLWGGAGGTFAEAQPLTGTDENPLVIPADSDTIVEAISTRPTAVDWDGDGDLDLVVGNFSGTFYLFEGNADGGFDPRVHRIKRGTHAPLSVPGGHSDPFVIDWDGDGDLDLLSGGGMGGLYLADNTAGPGERPRLAEFEEIIPQHVGGHGQSILKEEDLTGPAHSTRVWIDDVNGDGKLDVLLGDNVTLVSPAEGVSEEEFKTRQAEWQEAMNDAMRNDASNFQELYKQRSEFVTEQRTGFVWLYLQK